MAVSMRSHNSYVELTKHRTEACDFCERTFKNRFESIIHNASHIIIPLLKQNYHQCDICLHHFSSQEELYHHHRKKHQNTEIENKKNNNTKKIKLENSDPEHNFNYKDSVHDINNDLSRNDRKVIKTENDGKYNNKSIKKELKTECMHSNVSENIHNDCNNEGESIKNRLIFEDDDDDSFGKNTLTDITECKVKMLNEPLNQPGIQNIKPNGNHGIMNIPDVDRKCDSDDYDYDNFVITTPQQSHKYDNMKLKIHDTQNFDEIDQEFAHKSVHYTDLVRPGIFKCRFCLTTFPNRLLVIQHETTHIHIQQPRPQLCTYCDRYIAGRYVNLYRHIRSQHPGADLHKKHQTRRCKKCGLKYRKHLSHMRNYHPYDCEQCGKEYSQSESAQLRKHMETCSTHNVSSKILNVCELCVSFMKFATGVKYVSLGSTPNRPGVRYPCSTCGKQYFELQTVKREKVYNLNSLLNKSKKPMSNEERLKKFQHRLKKINLLNKFYFVFLFTCL
ncbi:zinc finger protein 729 [Bicyclus anynana]|uniref:Zinc finger protein 729 n=1 Tax=Bicyclus anynana TaxID=110368 RepID=A0A6J1P6B6_BICAN|nr:zinc finger protein 729 [Bicyclus anynana]